MWILKVDSYFIFKAEETRVKRLQVDSGVKCLGPVIQKWLNLFNLTNILLSGSNSLNLTYGLKDPLSKSPDSSCQIININLDDSVTVAIHKYWDLDLHPMISIIFIDDQHHLQHRQSIWQSKDHLITMGILDMCEKISCVSCMSSSLCDNSC